MTHKYSEYYIYTISSPLTLPCPSLPLNVMTYFLIYHMCMSLGPGHLSGDSSQEKTLKSQWLPEALHLGLGPCEISHPCGHAKWWFYQAGLVQATTVLRFHRCSCWSCLEETYLEAGNLVLRIFPPSSSLMLPGLLGVGVALEMQQAGRGTLWLLSLYISTSWASGIVSICCKMKLLW